MDYCSNMKINKHRIFLYKSDTLNLIIEVGKKTKPFFLKKKKITTEP